MTLIEIMVVVALIALVMGVSVPTLRGVLDAEQAGAARELVMTYRYLRDEAALRNVTFRVAYNLDARTYKVEVGEPGTLIFLDAETRREFEEEIQDQLDRFTDREIEEGLADDVKARKGRFEGLSDAALDTEVELPGNTFFHWVYTPQYDDPVFAPEDPSEDPEEQTILYSYIFPNGMAEQTVVRIADIEDPEDGFTLVVEPLSGRVILHDDNELELEDLLEWLPDEGPELAL
jgi:type II secretory pathway pseudopilin PulG